MATYIFDSFSGAADTALNVHAPEIGGTWDRAVGTQHWTLNGAGAVTTVNTQTVVYYNSITLGNDYQFTAEFKGTSSGSFDFLVRGPKSYGQNCYRIRFFTNNIAVERNFSNVRTFVGAIYDNNSYKSYRVTLSGATIKIFNSSGTELLSYTDGSPVSGSYFGMAGSFGTIDSLIIEDVGATVATATATAAGLATTSGAGVALSTAVADGSSAGIAASNAVGVSFHTGYGDIIAGATVTGVSAALVTEEATAQSSGAATASAAGSAVLTGVATAAGTSTAQGDTGGVGNASGASTATAIGSSVATSTFAAASSAAANAAGAGLVFSSSTGRISAAADMVGVKWIETIIEATGASAGSSTTFASQPGFSFTQGTAAGSASALALATAISTSSFELSIDPGESVMIGTQIMHATGTISASSASLVVSGDRRRKARSSVWIVAR